MVLLQCKGEKKRRIFFFSFSFLRTKKKREQAWTFLVLFYFNSSELWRSVTKFVFLPPTLQELHFTFFSFDSKLNTFPIWCLSLQHPSPCSYVLERRKEGCRATKLSDSVSGLLMPVYDCLWNKEGIKILSPLFLITESWLWALALYKPLDSLWVRAGGGGYSS